MKKGFRLLTVLALSGAMFCWLHLSGDAHVFASLDLLEQVEVADTGGCGSGGCSGTFCEICENSGRSCYEDHNSDWQGSTKICMPMSGFDCCL